MLGHGFRLLVGVVIAMSILTAGVSAQAANHSKSILFINPGYQDKGFWKAVTDTMRAAASHFGYQLHVVSGDRKWPLMLSRGLDAINTVNADYIVLVNEHQQAPALMKAAEERKTPYLLMLNNLTEEQEKAWGGPREKLKHWLGTITPDNEIAGYEMALSLEQHASKRRGQDNTIPLLTLAGDYKTPASISRLAGLERALADSSALIEKRRITVNWSEEEAYERTSIYLRANDVGAIWAANDNIATGAIRAIREAGKTAGKDIVVAGLNWSTAGIRAVIDGTMTLTHGGHFLAGAWSVVVIHDHNQGRDFVDIAKHLSFPMSAITRENAARYLTHFRNEDWSKINFSKFSRADNTALRDYPFNLQTILSAVEK